jgi:adenylate cyclase
MTETRKLAAILAADVAGYSRLTGADEEGTLARIRALRSELIDPAISANRGRVANTAGDSILVEFASVVDAVRAAIDIQRAMTIRNADFVPQKRIEFRVGIHLGDVMVESDGDLRGDGVNIAARLEGIAKPGGICLSSTAFEHIQGKVDVAVADLGEQNLKNIAKPVRVYALEVGKPTQAKPTKRAVPKQHSILLLVGAGIAALLIVIVGGTWHFFGANRTAPVASNAPAPTAEAARLSIVVLPFTNLSGDPSQDYFADGITENLTTDLSRIRDSFVIARNTAFTFKGKNVDARAIGKELGVRYVLEGSVQRDQNRVRVNAQLIDAKSGAHLWADHFEEDVADLFKLQDQVVARLANTLRFELVKAEAEENAHHGNPDAIDLTMRGRALMYQMLRLQQVTKDNNNAMRVLFEQALKIDPNDAEALTGDAIAYFFEYVYGWGNSETDYDAKILGQVERAIALAPDTIRAHYMKSTYLSLGRSRRFNEALRAADAGLAVDPNFAPLYSARATAEISLGRFEQAKSDVQQAMRLSPRDPNLGIWQVQLGDVEIGAGHTEAAIDQYQKALDAGNNRTYAGLAAAYALEGKMDEAKSALAEARRINPNLTLKWYREHATSIPTKLEGLRKAGLPEE